MKKYGAMLALTVAIIHSAYSQLPKAREKPVATGAIKVTVADKSSNAPVAAATVVVLFRSRPVALAKTDSIGSLYLDKIRPERYKISARATGYKEGHVANANIPAEKTTEYIIALEKE